MNKASEEEYARVFHNIDENGFKYVHYITYNVTMSYRFMYFRKKNAIAHESIILIRMEPTLSTMETISILQMPSLKPMQSSWVSKILLAISQVTAWVRLLSFFAHPSVSATTTGWWWMGISPLCVEPQPDWKWMFNRTHHFFNISAQIPHLNRSSCQSNEIYLQEKWWR